MSAQVNDVTEDAPNGAPEIFEINGVTYRREADWIDERVNKIKSYQAIADRTGLSLRQVFWFSNGFSHGIVMPE
jgi:hypothetical protein